MCAKDWGISMITKQDIQEVFDKVDFRPLRNKRVLMTGGTGFVGSWMSQTNEDFTFMRANRFTMHDLLRQNWDYIIHGAPGGMDMVIECAKRTDAVVLFTSSGAADTHRTSYGADKMHDEEKLLASGLDVRICRLYSFAGWGLPRHLALPSMINYAINNESVVLWAPHEIRSYMYASDMAVWLWNILLRGQDGGRYAIGSERAVTIKQLVLEIGKHFDSMSYFTNPDMPGSDRPVYLPDTHDTRQELGLSVTVDFEDAIERTVRSYRNA
jgi:nucleoside-diphosphate-sugar epimerase